MYCLFAKFSRKIKTWIFKNSAEIINVKVVLNGIMLQRKKRMDNCNYIFCNKLVTLILKLKWIHEVIWITQHCGNYLIVFNHNIITELLKVATNNSVH